MLLRDRLRARLAEMGAQPDHQRLAAEVLGIRNASPELARSLIAQALVIEDRHDVWRRVGDRVCAGAPASPGVYVLRDERGRALYVVGSSWGSGGGEAPRRIRRISNPLVYTHTTPTKRTSTRRTRRANHQQPAS